MSLPTVADVLAVPSLRASRPEVVAGRRGLDRAVRWVHTTELVDIAGLLRGGELVLSTGIALPTGTDGLREFAISLDRVGASGVVIELGRRWDELPEALVAECEALGLPLIALHEVVPFATVAQTVGELIVDEQLTELREIEQVHRTFTELSVAEAGTTQILQAVQRLSGASVVLENDQHLVIDYVPGPGDVAQFLGNWQQRSRAVLQEEHTTWNQPRGWLITRVGRRERRWGRLVLESPQPPGQRTIALVERAAAALALHRLHDRDRDNLARRTHHELMLRLLSEPTDADLVRRCELAGLPMSRHAWVGLAVRPDRGASASDDVLRAVVRACHELRAPALVCEIDVDVKAVVAAANPAAAVRLVDDLATRLHRHHEVQVSAGRPVTEAATIDRTIREAQHVMEAVRPDSSTAVHRLEDVHLRGLLTLLGDDDRLTQFVTRELEPVERNDAEHDGDLMNVLTALLQHPASKSDAAASLHLSRPAFYARLTKLGAVLGRDLDDPETRTSLHVALITRNRLD